MQRTCGKDAENMQKTSREHAENKQRTCRKEAEKWQKTIRKKGFSITIQSLGETIALSAVGAIVSFFISYYLKKWWKNGNSLTFEV
jgi:hypothetical protein